MKSYTESPPPTQADQILDRLIQIDAKVDRALRLFDEFAGTFLNARFPYGKPTDRWARR